MKALQDPHERRDFIIWVLALVLIVAIFALRGGLPWMASYPAAWVIPLTDWVSAAIAWSACMPTIR